MTKEKSVKKEKKAAEKVVMEATIVIKEGKEVLVTKVNGNVVSEQEV